MKRNREERKEDRERVREREREREAPEEEEKEGVRVIFGRAQLAAYSRVTFTTLHRIYVHLSVYWMDWTARPFGRSKSRHRSKRYSEFYFA